MELNAKNPVAYKYRGLVYFNTGNYQDAVNDLKKAIYLNPTYGFELTEKINTATEKIQLAAASKK
jgi:tetratricopeptide (TPR) repeat protein